MSLRSEVIRIYNELIAGAKKISELPASGALDGSELVEGVQGGANVKMTTQDIADLGGGGGGGWATTGTTNLTGNVEINGGADKDVLFNALSSFSVSTNSDINLTPTGELKINGVMGTDIAMAGNKVTGLGAAIGNGEAVRYEQLVLKQDLIVTETALTDADTIDLAQQNNTLATSRTDITFTISNTATYISLTITLTGTALTLTFPAGSLCVSEGVSSGDNTCALSGTSGDVYEIQIKKRGAAYSVVSKNILQ